MGRRRTRGTWCDQQLVAMESNLRTDHYVNIPRETPNPDQAYIRPDHVLWRELVQRTCQNLWKLHWDKVFSSS